MLNYLILELKAEPSLLVSHVSVFRMFSPWQQRTAFKLFTADEWEHGKKSLMPKLKTKNILSALKHEAWTCIKTAVVKSEAEFEYSVLIMNGTKMTELSMFWHMSWYVIKGWSLIECIPVIGQQGIGSFPWQQEASSV